MVSCYTFTVSAKMKGQDIWFLLVISAIMAGLRYVGDTTTLRILSKPVLCMREFRYVV